MDNKKIADLFRTRQLKLFRHQTDLRDEFISTLKSMFIDLAGLYIEYKPNSPQAVNLLASLVGNRISSAFNEMQAKHIDNMVGIGVAESAFIMKIINQEIKDNIAFLQTQRVEWVKLIDDQIVLGAPVKEWWQRQAGDVQRRYTDIVRTGIVSELSEADIVKSIRGTKQMGFKDGMLGSSSRWVKAIVRASYSSITTAAVEKEVESFPQVFSGVQQISVFDGRTSDVCIAYGGKVWDKNYKPVGHNLPYNNGCPRHPNCRSRIIPVAIGDSPAEDVSFDKFLEDKPDKYVDNLLGKGKSKLFREGKITLNDLVDSRGRQVSLEELTND